MRKTIIVLIIISIALGGCLPSIQNALRNLPGLPSTTGENLILGGSGGIKVEVISPGEDEPLNGDYPLAPKMKVINEGNSDSEGTLCIFGLDGSVFPSFSGCECESYDVVVLDDEDENYKEAIVEFPTYGISKGQAKGNLGMTISNKYKYTTRGKFEACIKKDPYSSKGCQVKSGTRSVNLLKSTTSGPVGITKVTEELTDQDEIADLVFTVEVDNKAGGNILKIGDYNSRQCSPEEGVEPEFEVRLINVPDEGEVMCGVGKFDEKGKGRISCEASISLFDSSSNYLYEKYLPEIEVEVTYTFEGIQSTQFTVG